jgi:Arc/MetJ-type ribon-helix-helix transcriptional regulator
MAMRKITITLESDQVAAVQNFVRKGRAKSLSGFVQHAVGVAIDDAAGWGSMLTEMLLVSGGPLKPDEQAWVDAAFQKSASAKKASKVRQNSSRLSRRVRNNAA